MGRRGSFRTHPAIDMHRTLDSTTLMHDALVAFLESRTGATFDDDVGPLLGQACEIRDHGIAEDVSQHQWVAAANAALSGEAMREVRSARPHGSASHRPTA